MGCQSEVYVGDSLTFSITTQHPTTAVATDADSAPSYRVYENETGTALLSGTLAKLDDDNTVGFYTETISCTAANGFEANKSYSIYILATVAGVSGTISYNFVAKRPTAGSGTTTPPGTDYDSSLGYSLAEALVDLKAGLSWLTRPVVFEPLDGVYDGVNKVLRAHSVPISSSDDLVLYDHDGAAIAASSYSVTSYDAGVFTFTAAPSGQVYGSFTAQALSDTYLVAILRSGFAEMQLRYPRDLWLYASGDTSYVSSSAAALTNPVSGSFTFSTSDAQKHLWQLCSEYRLYRAMQGQAALGSLQYREIRVGGLDVNATKRAGDLAALCETLDKQIETLKAQVQFEEDGVSAIGSFVPGAMSDQFKHDPAYNWYPDSEQGQGL